MLQRCLVDVKKLLRSAKKKTTQFARHNYRWLINLCISVVSIVVTILVVTLPDHLNPITRQYYYLPNDHLKTTTNHEVICWESRVSSRSDVYSCSINGRNDNASLIDPCFLRSDFKTVQCPSDPYASTPVYVIKEQHHESLLSGTTGHNPWFIKLSTGEKCQYFLGGASAFIDGRLDYACNDRTTYLSLPLDKSDPSWSIRCWNSSQTRVEKCKVSEAWF